jgi:hypothetical protein
MTERERLHTEGFHFFCFTKREARAGFSLKALPEEYACVDVDEVFSSKKFEVFFLGVKKLHHTPVKFTRPTEAL